MRDSMITEEKICGDRDSCLGCPFVVEDYYIKCKLKDEVDEES